MNAKETRFIGVWITQSFFEKIESYMKKNSFSTKSEFLRYLLREIIKNGGEMKT